MSNLYREINSLGNLMSSTTIAAELATPENIVHQTKGDEDVQHLNRVGFEFAHKYSKYFRFFRFHDVDRQYMVKFFHTNQVVPIESLEKLQQIKDDMKLCMDLLYKKGCEIYGPPYVTASTFNYTERLIAKVDGLYCFREASDTSGDNNDVSLYLDSHYKFTTYGI